jgi:hypothetical protein
MENALLIKIRPQFKCNSKIKQIRDRLKNALPVIFAIVSQSVFFKTEIVVLDQGSLKSLLRDNAMTETELSI